MRDRRNLTAGETSLAKFCFKNSINVNHVFVVKRMTTGKNHTAWAPFGRITFPKADFKEDFIGSNMRSPVRGSGADAFHDARWFLHELVHVWQYYVGMPVVHLGLKAVRDAKKTGADPYAYSLSGVTTTSAPDLLDFNIEQQGDIISDYFAWELWNDPYTPSYPTSSYEAVLQNFLENPSYAKDEKKGWKARAALRNLSA